MWAHLILALPFWWSQLSHMWTMSMQGVSISNYIITEIALLINFYLVLKMHGNGGSRLTYQIILIYILGFVTYGSFIVVMFIKDIGVWDAKDWFTIGLVLSLITVTTLIFWLSRRKVYNTIADPIQKGIYSAMVRAAPQIMWAWKVYTDGGAGLDPVMLIAFHAMTNIRIFQTYLAIREHGLDRNRKGLLIAEIANESSMILVTIIWAIQTF
ncbi:MAG: hypothetical protein ACKKL6_04120 [Candidatus Komeilibacteria bacterium]